MDRPSFRTIGDEVMEHAERDTFSTGDGLEMLDLPDDDKFYGAANLYLGALAIIRQLKVKEGI